LLPRSPGDPYPHGLAEAVLLSLDDLARVDPDGHARRLLDRLAVLAPTGADATLLNRLGARADSDEDGDEAEPVEVDALVATLSGRSLTIPGEEADRTVVHRLVQRVVRERCEHTGTLDAVITAAARALREAAGQIGAGWATRALIGRYAAHAATLITHPARDATRRQLLDVRLWMLHWLREVHNYTTAIAFGTALLADCEHTLGPTDRTTMRTRQNLAFVCRAVGRLDEAIDLYTRTLADRQRVPGPSHPDTLTARHDLADAYREAGRLDQAIDLYTRTLADRQRVLGRDHPDTLTSRHELAAAYGTVGRLSEAMDLCTRTLADRQRVLGPDHPDTLTSRHNLAYGYQEAGRLDEAIDL
jgi:tetratricopeptide (TPR) repeat protein